MESLRQQKASMNRCEKLRWKGMFIEADRDVNAQPGIHGPFWCQHTFKPFGPDGQSVDEFECCAARSCYEQL